MISRFRITKNGNAFRIEEYRRCGFLWLQKGWRQVRFGYYDGEHFLEQGSEFSTIAEAQKSLSVLESTRRKTEDPWTAVSTDQGARIIA
jgi:hypothetical protein